MGINIRKENQVNPGEEEESVVLTQRGLIEKMLKACGMSDCNTKGTPKSTSPLGTDKDGPVFCKDWDYASIVGMGMYLCNNTRPDIQYVVHQCARFSHSPKASHGVALKQICKYLQGTKDKGIVLKPSIIMKLDCYVDANFAGLWGFEEDQDPVCVKSRTGYVLTFGDCLVLWVSKL